MLRVCRICGPRGFWSTPSVAAASSDTVTSPDGGLSEAEAAEAGEGKRKGGSRRERDWGRKGATLRERDPW